MLPVDSLVGQSGPTVMKDSALSPGTRVFIVEDETIVAMLIEEMLEDLGYATAAHASTLTAALEFANQGDYQIGLLDINIIGGHSFPVAAIMAQRGIPFVFCSGYGALGIPDLWADAICISKPFSMAQLDKALRSAM